MRVGRWTSDAGRVLAAALVVGCSGDSSNSPSSPTNVSTLTLRIIGVPAALTVGRTYQLSAAYYTRAGSYVSAATATWVSGDASIVRVTSNGALIAQRPGVATVTAIADEGSATTEVIVLATAVAILPDRGFGQVLQLAPGQTLQFTSVEYAPNDQSIISINQGAWSSSDTTVASVSQGRLVTAVAPGTATITVTTPSARSTLNLSIASTGGSATIRMISVVDAIPTVTIRPSVGSPARLSYGDVSVQTVPAGTVQVSFDGTPPILTTFNDFLFGLQDFVGVLQPTSHETFIAINNLWSPNYYGPLLIASLEDRVTPVPPDSAAVRAVLGTLYGYAVMFTEPGAPASSGDLQGCLSGGPFGTSDYDGRSPGVFDIVLLYANCDLDGFSDEEAARFHVTATAGQAMTFIITGSDPSTFKMLSVVDR